MQWWSSRYTLPVMTLIVCLFPITALGLLVEVKAWLAYGPLQTPYDHLSAEGNEGGGVPHSGQDLNQQQEEHQGDVLFLEHTHTFVSSYLISKAVVNISSYRYCNC